MPNWKKVIVSGSNAALTSVIATAGFTGSLSGSALTSISSSFAQTSSNANRILIQDIPFSPAPIWYLTFTNTNSGYQNIYTDSSTLTYDPAIDTITATASYAINALTTLNAISSSHALTASYVNPLIQNVIITGSLSVSSSFTASGLNYPSADNGEESFMQTDGNGNLSLQYVKTIYEEIVNGESTNIIKGTPVYVSGSVGAAAKVFRADPTNPSKMPAVYIAADTIAPTQTGRGIALGLIKGVDTTGYPEGTEIYLAPGGGWTSTRPTGSTIVQVLGYVTKEGAGGQGVVLNPGPATLPNLPSGSVWVGNSNSFPTATLTSSLSVASAVSASHALTASFVNPLRQDVQLTGSMFSTGSRFTFRTTGTVDAVTITGSTGAYANSILTVNALNQGNQNGLRLNNLGAGDSGILMQAAAGGDFQFKINGFDITNRNFTFNSINNAFDSSGVSYTFLDRDKLSTHQKSFLIRGSTNAFKSGSYFEVQKSGSIPILHLSGDFQSGSFSPNELYISGSLRVNSGNSVITGSLTVNGSTTSTQIGAGAAPSGSVRLDVRAQGALSTDLAFRVRNNTDTYNILSAQGDGNIQIGSDAVGATRSTTIAAGNFSRLVLDTVYSTDTAVLSVSRRYFATVGRLSDNALILSHNFFADGNNIPYKMHFVNPSNYYGSVVASDGYNAGFMWFKDSSTIANLQMKLTPDNTLSLYTSSASPLESVITGSGFQIWASGSAGNAYPHIRTQNGTLLWLGSESRLFNLTASRTTLSASNATSNGPTLTVIGSGSAQPVFTVQGSQGELFSVTDSLSGSLFSVNDISGLPILEVFSDNTVLIGEYQSPALYTTKRVTSVAGNNVIYSLATSSYDGAFFDYVAKSGSNARAGNIMALWSGTSVNFTETTTTDFGNTSGLAFTVFISGSNLVLSGSTSTANWNIKTIIRSI